MKNDIMYLVFSCHSGHKWSVREQSCNVGRTYLLS